MGVFEETWPPRQLVRRIMIHMAGEIAVSEKPGTMLKKWRELFAASQLEVARHMGVTSSVVSDYEKGRRNPGSSFIRRFVEALIEIDAERGWPVVTRLIKTLNLQYLSAVIDMADYESGVRLDEVINAVSGVPLNTYIHDETVYGYTVIDSIKAIMTLNGNEFLSLLGSTSQRVVVFTNVSTGRSPMIALRVSTIKPAVIVLHGLRRVDYLALWIAETENTPVILSTARTVKDMIKRLRALASAPQ